jgi:Kef-type K+ transport system membrane component KefB
LGVLGVSLFLALMLGEVTSGLTGVLVILLRMILYLAVASAIGFWLLPKLAQISEKLPISQGLIAFTFATMLLYAWSAEVVGHLAAIIGAFLAGIFLSRSSLMVKINEKFSPIAFGVFVPIFFVNVGLSANVRQISLEGLYLLGGMTVVVIVSKLIGAGIGGRFGGMTNRESLQLGVGMIPRGEVVLIVATVGITEGLISAGVFSAVVVLVILTTLITPPILRASFFWQKSNRR